MRSIIISAIILAGCATAQTVQKPDIPFELLQPCGRRTIPPPAPKPTADRQTLGRFIVQIQLAREADGRALIDCSARQAKLVEMISHPSP